MSNSNIVIILTACINPNGMSFTYLQDSAERKKQYLKALEFYINYTSCKIVLVDNSLADLSNEDLIEKNKDRVEYITFDGNNYDKRLGKGIGELNLLNYAIVNSRFIDKNTVIIKITGRLIIENVNLYIKLSKICNAIIPLKFLSGTVYKSMINMESQIFICSTDFYIRFFFPFKSKMNDSEGIYFEHVLINSIKMAIKNGYVMIPFFIKPSIYGMSGSTGLVYKKSSIISRLRYTIVSIYLLFKINI